MQENTAALAMHRRRASLAHHNEVEYRDNVHAN